MSVWMGGFLGRIESRGEGCEMGKNLNHWRNHGKLSMTGVQREVPVSLG